jgi:hypothetical protein
VQAGDARAILILAGDHLPPSVMYAGRVVESAKTLELFTRRRHP